MKDFTNDLANFIVSNEKPRLDNIMREVAEKIQGDMISVTYSVIDAFYQGYSPQVYIRTDTYRVSRSHPKDKKSGQFRKKNKTELDRSGDVSLMSAIKSLGESGQPAIGVCRPLDGGFGYQAGVLFDESYFSKKMRHSVKGNNFTEWDIVEDFLWGVHGNESVATTTPSAGLVLYEYLNSYKPIFDMHYNNACKKFIK